MIGVVVPVIVRAGLPVLPFEKFTKNHWWILTGSSAEFFAVGIYGQYIFVDIVVNVVIVKTSTNQGFRETGQSGYSIKHKIIDLFRALVAAAHMGLKQVING